MWVSSLHMVYSITTIENKLELSKFLRLNFGGSKEWDFVLLILRYQGHDFSWALAIKVRQCSTGFLTSHLTPAAIVSIFRMRVNQHHQFILSLFVQVGLIVYVNWFNIPYLESLSNAVQRQVLIWYCEEEKKKIHRQVGDSLNLEIMSISPLLCHLFLLK